MKKSQVLTIVISLDLSKTKTNVESSIMFKKFKQNLATENFQNHSLNTSEINFFATSSFNLSKYENFANLSFTNLSIYNEFFNHNVNEPFLFDVCMFMHNVSYGYLNFTGKIAYGVVANDSIKTSYLNCSELIHKNKNPCHNYEFSKVISSPLILDQKYYSLYFVYCYK
jgi:hypothetical protein